MLEAGKTLAEKLTIENSCKMDTTDMKKSFNCNDKIRGAILEVIAFFDLFDCPLTAFEVWKFLPVKCGLAEVMEALDRIHGAASPSPKDCDNTINSETKKLSVAGGVFTRYSPSEGGEAQFFNAENIGKMEDYLPMEVRTARLRDLEVGHEIAPERKDVIEHKNGFYFLKGRSKLYDKRLTRYNFADRKYRRAKKIARIFKYIPWIKLIEVGNIIGGNNAKADSDVDLLIVCENKRVWLSRFFCAGYLKLLGLRPRPNKARNKICLSFFVAESFADLRDLMIRAERKSERLVPVGEILHSMRGTPLPQPSSISMKIEEKNCDEERGRNFSDMGTIGAGQNSAMSGQNRSGEQLAANDEVSARNTPPGRKDPLPPILEREDIYFLYWLANLVPIYEKDDSYRKFVGANSWLTGYLPNWEAAAIANRHLARVRASGVYDILANRLFGKMGNFLKKLQIKHLPNEIRKMMNKDSRVVVNDNIIKTHTNDRREYYREKWAEKIRNLSGLCRSKNR